MKHVIEKKYSLNLMSVPVFVFFVLLFLSPAAWSATYYVDGQHEKAGDGNPGTESMPWKTVGKAAATARAGDTVYVKTGVYREWVNVKNSGAPGQPIVFQAYPENHPVIDGTGVDVPAWNGLFNSRGNDYITIDGFEVRNTDELLVAMGDGDNLTVKNCIVHNNDAADGGPTHRSAIFIDHCNRGWVQNNEVYDAGWNGLHGESINNVIYENNYVHDVTNHNGINLFPTTSEKQVLQSGNHIRNNIVTRSDTGMYIRYQVNSTISNNLVYGNLHDGIRILDHPSAKINFQANMKIINNTIANNQDNGITDYNATHLTIKNNILYKNGRWSIYINGGVTDGHAIDYNLYSSSPMFAWGGKGHNDLASWQSASRQDANSFIANPDFANADSGDFSLATNSGAIDKGVNLSGMEIMTDLKGTARPQGGAFDIGAYEFTTQMALFPPKNLRIIQ